MTYARNKISDYIIRNKILQLRNFTKACTRLKKNFTAKWNFSLNSWPVVAFRLVSRSHYLILDSLKQAFLFLFGIISYSKALNVVKTATKNKNLKKKEVSDLLKENCYVRYMKN